MKKLSLFLLVTCLSSWSSPAFSDVISSNPQDAYFVKVLSVQVNGQEGRRFESCLRASPNTCSAIGKRVYTVNELRSARDGLYRNAGYTAGGDALLAVGAVAATAVVGVYAGLVAGVGGVASALGITGASVASGALVVWSESTIAALNPRTKILLAATVNDDVLSNADVEPGNASIENYQKRLKKFLNLLD